MDRPDVQTHDDLACLCPADAEAHDAVLMMALDGKPTDASAPMGLVWNNVEAYIPPSTHANTPQRQQQALKIIQLINRCEADEAPQDLVHRTLKRISQHTQFKIPFARRAQPSHASKPAFSFAWWREWGAVAAMFLLGMPMLWQFLSQATHDTKHADRHSLTSVEHAIPRTMYRYDNPAIRHDDLLGRVSQSVAPTALRLAATGTLTPAIANTTSAYPFDLFFNRPHLQYPQLADGGALPNRKPRPDKAILASSSLSIEPFDPNGWASPWDTPTPTNGNQTFPDSSRFQSPSQANRSDTVWLQRVVEDNTHAQQAFQTSNLMFVPVSNR